MFYIGTECATSSSLYTLINSFIFYCRPKLKDHMKYCADHPEENSKIAKVKAQVSEVSGAMTENIEKVRWFLALLFLSQNKSPALKVVLQSAKYLELL